MVQSSTEERRRIIIDRATKWRLEHPERAKEIQRTWRERHINEAREKNRIWHQKNPEKAYQATRRWRERNRAQVNSVRNDWQARNSDIINGKRRHRYSTNAAERRSQFNEQRKQRKLKLIEILGGKCVDCGQVPHLAAFEFDHVNGEKVKNVGIMLSTHSWKAILAEALKCELVCANCHRVRTSNRTGKL